MKASEVLAKSIADIQDGKWICGSLDKNKGPNNHMGCAIGLVAIHSGHVEDRERNRGYKAAMYLTDNGCGDPPKAGVEAARYLAVSLDPEFESSGDIHDIEEAVVNHNDSHCTSQEVAEKWFKDALMRAELDGN